MASTMSSAMSRSVVSLPPVIVRNPSTPSRARWSSIVCARVTSRVSAPAFASWNSGRTPAHTRSARASRKPGTSRSPSSSICSTSSWVTSGSSGSFTADVRRADHRHGPDRDEDVAVRRHRAAVDHRVHEPVVHRDHDPLAGDDLDTLDARHRGDLPGPRAGRVEHEARLDRDVLAAALVVQPRADDAVAVAQDVDDPVVGEQRASRSTAAPASAHTVFHASMPASGTVKARRMPGFRRGSIRRASATSISSVGTPVRAQPARNWSP